MVFDLTPPEFTLSALQRVTEAILGLALHKQNFRRAVERTGLVEGSAAWTPARGGAPPSCSASAASSWARCRWRPAAGLARAR